MGKNGDDEPIITDNIAHSWDEHEWKW